MKTNEKNARGGGGGGESGALGRQGIFLGISTLNTSIYTKKREGIQDLNPFILETFQV